MATLAELLASGAIVQIGVRLDRRQQPMRSLMGTPQFLDWLKSELPKLVTDRQLDETPSQQMLNLAHEFISGGPFPFDYRFKFWQPVASGVWYLKTPDLRIFGWFPFRDHFVAAFGNSKHNCMTHKLYPGYCTQVVRVRDHLPLNDPKFIAGGNPDDVLSARN